VRRLKLKTCNGIKMRLVTSSYQSGVDDEAASDAPEHSLPGRPQTSRRRLAMTHRRQCRLH
jgi:hypothetical protein